MVRTSTAQRSRTSCSDIPQFSRRLSPVAVIAPKPGNDDLTLEVLQPYFDEHLARYKHPKDIVIVDALPRNASGKVVKGELRGGLSAVTQG